MCFKNNYLMKKFLCAICVVSAINSYAQNDVNDTTLNAVLNEVTVVATRATSNTPVAFSNVTKGEIEQINYGKDLPHLLNMLPGVTTSSDAGTGIGYTGIHVRGTDPTRINITANGVPMNDAESSQLYWVNISDFASSVKSIQVQRGVGTSTNGAGAFGATVNMLTDYLGGEPYAGIDVSAGSYGTHKETVRFSTGTLGNHWGFQGRLSNIGSDGYINRAESRLYSYFLQGGYFNGSTAVKLITFGGKEKTYMAWDYASRADMEKYGRRYNPSGQYLKDDGTVAYYSNQTDNYKQQHYQLILNQQLGRLLSLNATLHYTHGNGYYEQYKSDQKLYKYQIDGGLRADLIRQKKMLNDFYGIVASLNYDNRNGLSANLGGAWNKYDGDHFGKVIWVGNQYYWNDLGEKEYTSAGSNLSIDNRYYDNNAKKTDGNIYAKVNYEFVKGLNAYVDLQYRHVSYKMSGTSQEYDDSKQQIPLNLDRKYNFFNPKVGLFYHFGSGNSLYASYAIAHEEPTRNDFEDMLAESEAVDPKQERLDDLEIGYKFEKSNISAGVNFYYMNYDNQFVLTGAQDSNGEMVARNIKDSYRAGVELMFGWQPVDCFRWDINGTFSRNRARNMSLTIINDDWSTSTANVGTTPLAFSPSVIVNNRLTFNKKGFTASLTTKYVSKQYMTNSGFKEYLEDNGTTTSAMIDAMIVSDLDLSYTFKFRSIKSATIGVTVYNLFNEKYESNGSCSMNFKKDGDKVVAYNAGWAWSTYSAQAPTHVLAHLSINF